MVVAGVLGGGFVAGFVGGIVGTVALSRWRLKQARDRMAGLRARGSALAATERR